MRKIEIDDTQLQVLIAQYLREHGYYQTVYALQQESDCQVPLCSKQIDMFNSLFMSNQFIDCYNFIRHMVQNDRLRQISLKLQLLDAALYSDEPSQAIGNIISQSKQLLGQEAISQFYKLSEQNLDHRLFN